MELSADELRRLIQAIFANSKARAEVLESITY